MFTDAVHALKQGEVIAVPTEAVYGLSVDPRNEVALQRLLDLKKRNPEKGLILVGSDFSQFEDFIEPLSADMYARVMATWPGPHTWIVPAKKSVHALLRGKHNTLAVRITAHTVMSGLCEAFNGPIVSTSANPEGLPPALSVKEIKEYFGNNLLIVSGELGGLTKPTEIRDARTGQLIRG